ncbi:MAG: hypothetical protein WD872_09135 [Pirellulaceae bacterium]
MPETIATTAENLFSTSLERPPVAASVPVAIPAVRAALAAIWQDSVSHPAEYLANTVVPHGGE